MVRVTVNVFHSLQLPAQYNVAKLVMKHTELYFFRPLYSLKMLSKLLTVVDRKYNEIRPNSCWRNY